MTSTLNSASVALFLIFGQDLRMRRDRGCARVRKRKGERKDDGGKGGWWYTLQLVETEGGT